jgi:hypothetical protein
MRFERGKCVFNASLRDHIIRLVSLLRKDYLEFMSVEKAGFLVLFARKDLGCSIAF